MQIIQELNCLRQLQPTHAPKGVKVALEGENFTINIVSDNAKKAKEIASKLELVGEMLYLIESISQLDGLPQQINDQIKKICKQENNL